MDGSSKGRFDYPDAFALLLFIALSLLMTFPLILHLEDHIPSDRVDPLYTVWVMNWELKSGLRGFQGFFNAPIFHPHTGTLLYADFLPALTLLAAPLYLLHPHWVWVYNILFIFAYVLCGWGMYRLVLYLTGERVAAFTAGLIFAFFTYRFAHISHLELLTMGWMPFLFLSLFKFFDRPAVRHILGIGLFFVLQTWSCAYYGAFLGIFFAVALFYLTSKTKAYRRLIYWKRMLLLAGSGLLFLVPYYLPYLIVHQKMLFSRSPDEVVRFSAQLQFFLSVPRWTSLWGRVFRSQPSPEWIRYPGIVAVALAAAGAVLYGKTYGRELGREGKKLFLGWDLLVILAGLAWLQIDAQAAGMGALLRMGIPCLLLLSIGLRVWLAGRRKRTDAFSPPLRSLALRLFLAILLASWLLSLGPRILLFDKPLAVGPYKLLYEGIPGFQGLRAPGRLIVITMLAAAVLAGTAVARWSARIKPMAGRAALGGLLTILVLADYAAVPLPLAEVPVGKKIPPIYEFLRGQTAPDALIEFPLPMTPRENGRNALLMYYSIYHGKPLVQGYSGYFPPGYTAVREVLENFPSDKTIGLLRDLGVGYVIVHAHDYRKEDAFRILEDLAERPDDADRLADLEEDVLFRLRPGPPRAPLPAGEPIPGSDAWKAWASSNAGEARAALDGKPDTAWSTAATQARGDYFSLEFPEPLELSGIELLQGPNPLDFPRSFVVERSEDGLSWTELLAESEGMPVLTSQTIEDFRNYRMLLSFPSRSMRYLRVRLTDFYGRHLWSIGEIVLRR
jgi:hypothetical protein